MKRNPSSSSATSEESRDSTTQIIDVFPYGDILQKDISIFATQMFDLSHAESIIARPDHSKRTSEAVIVALRFIEKNKLNLSNACFCECFGNGAEVCISINR